MKSLRACCTLALFLAAPAIVSAQLLPEQRLADFNNLVSLYSRRYAPATWKLQALGVSMFKIGPWLDRVKAAKDDIEFFEIEAEYVAQLKDTHSGFQMTSNFRADMGITVDIYDNKVLIDAINRAVLPASQFAFQIGDELVSVDGKSVEDWITTISKFRQYGNPVTTRRFAAAQITQRSQATYPRAFEIGESASVEIRRASSSTADRYTLPWTKSGTAVTRIGVVTPPQPNVQAPRAAAEPTLEDLQQIIDDFHTYKLPATDLSFSQIPWATQDDGTARSYVTGIGARAPIYIAGLPSNFVQRLGRVAADFHFSGTYQSGGNTIGYIRIPSFAPANLAQAIAEFTTEMDFFQRNTQGLVIDVMRNPGGGCYMLDVTARLMSTPFYFFGEQVRPTQDRMNSNQSLLDLLTLIRVDRWITDTLQVYLTAQRAAYSQPGGLTGPIPACTQGGNILTAPLILNNSPAATVYTKPTIVLVDEFSISAADIFPSMIQDNGRAPLVGMRTSGGGGSVSSWPSGFLSESIATNTNSLVVRKTNITTPDLPPAPYVENIGARPDIPLNYMTRDNLINAGRPFVTQFTDIILDQISKARP